jgi:hypothetical protein
VVSKIQNATVIPKSRSEQIRQSRRSVRVGKSKLHPATWMAVNSRVAKQRKYSWMLYGFIGNLSFGIRCIGRSGGITGIFMKGCTLTE